MKKLLLRGFISGIILAVLVVLFRGPLFRLIFKYDFQHGFATAYSLKESDTVREAIFTFLKKDYNPSLEEMAMFSLKTTARGLSFKLNSKGNFYPLILAQTNEANCIGYSAYYCAVFNDLLEVQGKMGDYQVSHVRGKVRIFGNDWQGANWVPGWMKDHDYVLISGGEDGAIAVDPAVWDYFRIGRVRFVGD